MLQFIDYEVRADLSTSYNVERKRCVADDQDITRTRSTFWMKKKWKNINSSRRSTELLENWWVKMEKRGSHWCVCVDSKNCKIYIDRWRPLWVLCYCKTLAGNLPMLITVCTFFAAELDGHCLYLIYSYCLSSDCNTKHETRAVTVIDIGPFSRTGLFVWYWIWLY